jgi:hypothetical protein
VDGMRLGGGRKIARAPLFGPRPSTKLRDLGGFSVGRVHFVPSHIDVAPFVLSSGFSPVIFWSMAISPGKLRAGGLWAFRPASWPRQTHATRIPLAYTLASRGRRRFLSHRGKQREVRQKYTSKPLTTSTSAIQVSNARMTANI